MYAVADVDFVGENILDVANRPLVLLAFGLSLKDMGERSVLLVVQPCRSWYVFIVKYSSYSSRSYTMRCKVEYLFNYPPCVLIGYDFALDFRVLFVADWRIRSVVRSADKAGFHCRLDLFAGLSGVHFI